MSDGAIVGLVLGALGLLFFVYVAYWYGWWPFTVDKRVEEPSRAEYHTTLADLEKKDNVPEGSYHRPWVRPSTTTLGFRLFEKDGEPVDNGVYLSQDGKAHKCNPPRYEWKRGSNLKNTWLCECGKRYRLVAYKKTYARGFTAFNKLLGLDNTDAGKRLTYFDILKIGNEDKELSTPLKDLNDAVQYPHEYYINRKVSFVWERITRKPKVDKEK